MSEKKTYLVIEVSDFYWEDLLEDVNKYSPRLLMGPSKVLRMEDKPGGRLIYIEPSYVTKIRNKN